MAPEVSELFTKMSVNLRENITPYMPNLNNRQTKRCGYTSMKIKKVDAALTYLLPKQVLDRHQPNTVVALRQKEFLDLSRDLLLDLRVVPKRARDFYHGRVNGWERESTYVCFYTDIPLFH